MFHLKVLSGTSLEASEEVLCSPRLTKEIYAKRCDVGSKKYAKISL